MTLRWRGSGLDEHAVDAATAAPSSASIRATSGRPRSIRCSATLRRRAGSSAGRRKSAFAELVREMVESDWRLAQRDALVEREGFAAYKHHE